MTGSIFSFLQFSRTGQLSVHMFPMRKCFRLSNAVSTQAATVGSDKSPLLKNPWSQGVSNSSNTVRSMICSARPPGRQLSSESGVAMKYCGLLMVERTSASSSPAILIRSRDQWRGGDQRSSVRFTDLDERGGWRCPP